MPYKEKRPLPAEEPLRKPHLHTGESAEENVEKIPDYTEESEVKEAKLEVLRKEILGENKKHKKIIDRVNKVRRSQQFSDPIEVTPEQQTTIATVATETKEKLERNYRPGFGITPSSEPDSNFYNQVYARDGAHAIGNYFAATHPEVLEDYLHTILRYQREDGALPLRVEREYQQLKLWPGVKHLAQPLFVLIENRIRGRTENPIYEGGDFGASGSEDTIPALLISVGEFFLNSEKGKEFAQKNFDQLERAVTFFRKKIDAEDGLAVATRNNPDWADSLVRKGKLGGINIWWARGLRVMEFVSRQIGQEEKADEYRAEFRKVKGSILEKLYDAEEGYFRAAEGEDRVDTVASIFGALYLLNTEEAVKVEETLKRRVTRPSGLANFDPPYLPKEIFSGHKILGRLAKVKNLITGTKEHGMDEYHNTFVWPWVTLQNIQVKIKIALQHSSETVRLNYKQEAIDDLIQISNLFKELGGAYEVVDPNEPKPANIAFYTPPQNLMASMAAYQSAYRLIKDLGWL